MTGPTVSGARFGRLRMLNLASTAHCLKMLEEYTDVLSSLRRLLTYWSCSFPEDVDRNKDEITLCHQIQISLGEISLGMTASQNTWHLLRCLVLDHQYLGFVVQSPIARIGNINLNH